MRFTIEYDMEKKEGTVVPGSFEMDEAKGVSDEERLTHEGVSLYMEALADTYAGYFGEIASSFQNGELEMRLNLLYTGFGTNETNFILSAMVAAGAKFTVED